MSEKGNINDLKRDILDMIPEDSDIAEGRQVVAGEAMDSSEKMASHEDLENALREIYDPEIPVNIYDLGLIYDLQQKDNGDVAVLMTLTAPACPVAGEMPAMVAHGLAVVEGVGQVVVTLTWHPPWTMEKMSADAKIALGFGPI